MTIPAETVAVIGLVSLVLAVLLGLAVTVLALRLRLTRRSLRHALGDAGPGDLVAAVAAQRDELAALRAQMDVLAQQAGQLREVQRNAVARVSLVRYDAFPDMGGMLSFSAALLDEHGDGVVVSAINGRSESRAYGKPVTHADSDVGLSPEEREAIDVAMAGPRRTVSAPSSNGRRRRRP